MTISITHNWTPVTEKTCPCCIRLLSVSCFYEDTRRPPWTKGRYSKRCKECVRAEKRKGYHAKLSASRARSSRYQRAYAARVRAEHLDRARMGETAWKALCEAQALSERRERLIRESHQDSKALKPYKRPHPLTLKFRAWEYRKRMNEQASLRDYYEAAAARALAQIERSK